MHITDLFGHGARRRVVPALALAAAVVLAPPAVAQDGSGGPPPPLEVPGQTNIAIDRELRSVSLSLIRQEMERAVDLVICEKLMRDAEEWPTRPPQTNPDGSPRAFRRDDCTPPFQAMLQLRRGSVRWRSDNARFTRCTDTFCFSHASMAATDNTTRPNLRQARLSAHLALAVGGTFGRDVDIPLDLAFTCDAPGGSRNGVLRLSVRPGPPAIGGAGPIEAVLDFLLLPFDISGTVATRVKAGLDALQGTTAEFSGCSSIGVYRPDLAPAPGGHSLNGQDEAIVFNAPVSGLRLPAIVSAGAGAALREQVTVEFLGLARNPLPPLVAPEHAAPGNPLAAEFVLYLNGAPVVLPADGLMLPPEGGRVGINFCKTVDVSGRGTFQLLFVNGLGGAAWAEFGRAGEFGAGGQRRITTVRRILVPPLNVPGAGAGGIGGGSGGGSGGGLGGPPTQTHPTPLDLREFELLYRIRFAGIPTLVSDPGRADPGGLGGVGGLTGLGELTGSAGAAATTPVTPAAPALDRWGRIRTVAALGARRPPITLPGGELTPEPCRQL